MNTWRAWMKRLLIRSFGKYIYRQPNGKRKNSQATKCNDTLSSTACQDDGLPKIVLQAIVLPATITTTTIIIIAIGSSIASITICRSCQQCT